MQYKRWLSIVILSLGAATVSSEAQTIVLANARVLEGADFRLLEGAAIVVRGGKIAHLETKPFSIPANAEVVDVDNNYLLPGLIDAHAHIGTIAGANRAVHSGITTVRSASPSIPYNDVTLREMVKQGLLPGPEILAAGLYVTPFLGERILGDVELVSFYAGGITTTERLRQVIGINIRHGVDHIKIRANERSGIVDQDLLRPTYSADQLQAIVEEASKRGLPVMCHAHSDDACRDAVEAGVRSIEHGTFLSEETLKLMKERGVFLVPTYSEFVDLSEPGGEYDSPILEQRGKYIVDRLGQTIERAHELGIRIAAGGDTTYEKAESLRLVAEIRHFLQFGFTPLEALQSATTVAAEVLGIEDQTGRIEPGLDADIIVVSENPLHNPWTLHYPLLIMSNGHIVTNRLDLLSPN